MADCNLTFEQEQLLIRPVQLYEVPYPNNSLIPNDSCSNVKLQSAIIYAYKSNQRLKSTRNLNLVNNILAIQNTKFLNPNINSNIELINNYGINSLSFQVTNKLYLNNYISSHLKLILFKNEKSKYQLKLKKKQWKVCKTGFTTNCKTSFT